MRKMWRWYLIHTKPAAERLACTNLERQGYEVYLPRLQSTVRHAGRLREKIGPLFPRYLFLKLQEERQSLAPVRSSVGVMNVVRFGIRYAIVPDEIIEGLRAHADPETGLHHLQHESHLEPGAAVRVTGGPFDGLEGVFLRAAGEARVIVLLELLGQNAAVRIPMDVVVPSHAP